jgi:oligoendopeptidase F
MPATEFPRRFVASDAVLDDFARIEPYFDDLRDRDIDEVAALECWLLDASELAACLSEQRTERYVRMT